MFKIPFLKPLLAAAAVLALAATAPAATAPAAKPAAPPLPPPEALKAHQAVLAEFAKDHREQVVQWNQVIDKVVQAGPYQPTWESMERRYKVPEWYQDAKFGIFIHWGVYSVPGFGTEWYPRRMYDKGSRGNSLYEHHLQTYGPHAKFGYKDFIPMFKAEKFDAGQWATIFKNAGAKFVVPVAEHHDGFQMYDSELSDWNSFKMGPKRDVVGELAKAVRTQGMLFGLSSHRAEHWFFMGEGMKFDSDVRDPKYAAFYGPAYPASQGGVPTKEFLENWLARTCELVDKYQPQLVWFDWWIENKSFEPYLQKFAAFYYNRGEQWGRGVAINYKKEAIPAKAAVLDIERGQLGEIRPYFWQTDTAVGKNSWGYVKNMDYKTADSIVDDLIDIVSKNGALLLNIGPAPDGTIPAQDQQILAEIGVWLKTNGEAIYGTRPFKVFGEGPTEVVTGSFADTKRKPFTGQDFRFTTKGDTIYAIALDWPQRRAVIKSLAQASPHVTGEVKEVTLLGAEGKLRFRRSARGLVVVLPRTKPGANAYVIKISGLKVK